MKKVRLFLFSAVFILLSILTNAQYKLSGIIVDTAGMTNMAYTSISIMSSKDSVLQNFTRADEEGKFSLELKQDGKYFIRYSHPSFTSFVVPVDVRQANTVLDTAYMLSLQNLLEEFIVRDNRPIIIKGDTIEYNADSFKVSEFANVDELLRRLPGIEVDKNGKITAQGKKVEKMLVDGDEFFSDDPAVLAKMLRASAIDKVQVFDNKSDVAKATGIDDGEQVRTINLTLKDSAKQGYFGKVAAGAGPPGFYQGQTMINAYRKKQKFTAFAIGSNTNKVGLGWDDANKFGGDGRTFTENDDGTWSMSSGLDNDFGGYDGTFRGQGLPRSINGGLHYDNKFGKEQNSSYGIDYRINSNGTKGYQNTRTQYIMPDTQYLSNNHYEFDRQNLSNAVAGKTSIIIDSLHTLNVKVNGSVTNSKTNSLTKGNNSDMQGNLINESSNQTDGESNKYTAGIDLTFAKKLKKEGRVIAANATANINQNNGENNFESYSVFHVSNSDLRYNQIKKDSSRNVNTSFTLSYSEPLIKDKLYLSANASTRYIDDKSSLSTYDKTLGNENVFNQAFSTNMAYSVFTNSIASYLRYTGKPWNLYGGLRVASTQYQNINNFTGDKFARDYLNFFPTAVINYNKSRDTRMSLRYNGSSQQPSVGQIQVMVRNNDPLNVRLGNPDLTQQFRHNFSTSYSTYKTISERSTYISANVSMVQNAFAESRSISSDGINTFKTINIDGNWNANLWGYYSFKIKPIKTSVEVGINGSYNVNNTLLNNIKNTSKNTSINPTLGFNHYSDTGLSFDFNFSPNYNINRNTVNTGAKTNFYGYNQNLDISYRFRFGLEVGLESIWNYREKMDINDKNNSILINNFYIQKPFLKDKSLIFRIEGNDIFNQNLGVSRNNFDNLIVDSDYSIIRRYFMFNITWNFTKSKGASKANDETNIIEID